MPGQIKPETAKIDEDMKENPKGEQNLEVKPPNDEARAGQELATKLGVTDKVPDAPKPKIVDLSARRDERNDMLNTAATSGRGFEAKMREHLEEKAELRKPTPPAPVAESQPGVGYSKMLG